MVKRDVTKETSISYSLSSLRVYKTAGRHQIKYQEKLHNQNDQAVELAAKGGCESLSVQICEIQQTYVIQELNQHCHSVRRGVKIVALIIVGRLRLAKLVFVVMGNPRETCFVYLVGLLFPVSMGDCNKYQLFYYYFFLLFICY